MFIVFGKKSNAIVQSLFAIFSGMVIFGMVCTPSAFARNRSVPLLPPKPDDEVTQRNPNTTNSDFDLFSIGFEAGMMGRQSLNGLYGAQSYFGGRAFFTLGLLQNLSIKASIGYFGQTGSTIFLPALEQDLETGAIIRYTVFNSRAISWWGGLSQKIDYLINGQTLALYSTSGVGSVATPQFRYRIGPATGLAFHLDPEWDLTTDLEVTFSFTDPVRTYGGLAVGLVYHLF